MAVAIFSKDGVDRTQEVIGPMTIGFPQIRQVIPARIAGFERDTPLVVEPECRAKPYPSHRAYARRTVLFWRGSCPPLVGSDLQSP